MPSPPSRKTKRRLSPDESKALALAAARELLIEGGPQAITLKAVAAKIGQTHSNLLHHFGSVAALHRELTLYLAKSLYESLVEAFHRRMAGTGTVRDSVDAIFDAFAKGGGARLCAWLVLSGNTEFFRQFAYVFASIPDAGAPGGKSSADRRAVAFQMSMLALADGLMGDALSSALGLPRDAGRQIAVDVFSALLAEEFGPEHVARASGSLEG